MAHMEGVADVQCVNAPQTKFIGTRGESRRLEGFAIELTGAGAFHIQRDLHDPPPRHWRHWFFQNGQFCGTVSKAYESVDSHVRNGLRQWLGRKHKIKGRVENQFPDEYLYQQLGVIRLTHYRNNLPWAKAK
jgi:hypothetical protein